MNYKLSKGEHTCQEKKTLTPTTEKQTYQGVGQVG